MPDQVKNIKSSLLPDFDRHFIDSPNQFSKINGGNVGGKAAGMINIYETVKSFYNGEFHGVKIDIPKFVVIGTDHFDNFMKRNDLYEVALSGISDEKKVLKFFDTSLPTEILGDLRSIAQEFHTPLAVRSSSLLEDSLKEPFAGIYATKMISNDQPDVNVRYEKLIEAIKYVYASTFFQSAIDYFSSTEHSIENEKMAVIIQMVVGKERNKRFYPALSGVIKSFNYYPLGKSKPEDGIVNLALGLGKTIVDGGVTWTYSPEKPKAPVPFADPGELMKNTQTRFWAINMNPRKKYDPTKETEYLFQLDLKEADYDGTLKHVASTFNPDSNRVVMGIGVEGPRIIDFAPLLKLNEFGYNKLISKISEVIENYVGQPVEIEFAIDFDHSGNKLYFGLLQVRPMFVSKDKVELSAEDLNEDNRIIYSERAMGNGIKEDIYDVVYVDPDMYDKKNNPAIAGELEQINRSLVNLKKKYLLIGFGRWGSSDPWLGIPVNWGQISGAKVIVESTLPEINVDLSQGSHFFHNLSAYNVFYFSIRHELDDEINWEFIKQLRVIKRMKYTVHAESKEPLLIKVDGKICTGVIRNAG